MGKSQDLLKRVRLSGRSFARLLAGAGLRRQNRDANTLTGLDVVRIVERRVKLVNLLQKLRRTCSKFLHTNTEQCLPWCHLNDAYGIRRSRSSISNQ